MGECPVWWVVDVPVCVIHHPLPSSSVGGPTACMIYLCAVGFPWLLNVLRFTSKLSCVFLL